MKFSGSGQRTVSRVAHWDNIKLIMIILMVIGHFADRFTDKSNVCKSIYLFIYAFHMPVLLFVSGLFYKNKENAKKVLYYCSCGFALKITFTIFYRFVNHSTSFSLLSDAAIPWFMFVLAIYQMSMYFIRNFNKKYLLVMCFILACFVGHDETIGNNLYLSRVIIFFPFYLLGTMLDQKLIGEFIHKYIRLLLPVAIVILSFWFYLCFFKLDSFYKFRHLLNGKSPFSEEIIGYGPIARVMCYIITCLTGASMIVLIPKIPIRFFTSLGEHTINVYYWHFFFLIIFERKLHFGDLYSGSYVGKTAYFLVAVLLSIMLMHIRIFDYPVKIIKKFCFSDNIQNYDR